MHKLEINALIVFLFAVTAFYQASVTLNTIKTR